MSNAASARPRTVGVILAGGTGERMGLSVPKQLLKVAGKPIIEHTLAVFQASEVIDEIYVMMTPGFVRDVEKIVANQAFGKVRAVLEGGGTRADTTMRAIEALGDRDCNILLHDAVRPLVDQRILRDCVAALDRYEAIDVAIPSADTLITVDTTDDEVISTIPERSRFRRGQTPQGFRLGLLRRAYELAAADPAFTTTDDCGVVRRYMPEVPIHVVAGTEHNMKVTHPIDVYLVDRLFQLASRVPPRAGTEGHDFAALAGKTLVVFGGSYGIGEAIVGLAARHGANVASFSRSTTGTHVEDADAVGRALAEVYAEHGRIDYVVNTAGQLHKGRLDEFGPGVIDEALRVNFLAPVNVARLSLPYLRDTGGALLLYTSSSYTRGRAGYSMYSSTKAAVVNLTQALADEWAADGVRVNCVNPERTATPMRTKAFGQEAPDTLLTADSVAHTSLDVLVSTLTGQIIDVRRGETEPSLEELADTESRSE
ncbi:SDR family NAD(P)-dependent oxidoreductase [Stackebrandtia sp.]|uniref:SDR family NAD(P)-dependent oxidoreductase n=1 Tax=Stackebrandtia sp. TaxID=2023065 RepID=UPI0039C9A1E4